jgi:hypothetical protein
MMTMFKKPEVGLRQRLTFDDFLIIEQVGEGTYGCVYLPSPMCPSVCCHVMYTAKLAVFEKTLVIVVRVRIELLE